MGALGPCGDRKGRTLRTLAPLLFAVLQLRYGGALRQDTATSRTCGAHHLARRVRYSARWWCQQLAAFPPKKTERMERGPARSVLSVLIPLPRGYPRFGYFALRAGTASICAECRELSRASPAIRFPHADARCARGTKCAQQHLLVGRIKVAPP